MAPVPDWTYVPLRRPMRAVLGQRRSLILAARVLGALARVPGGRLLIAGFGRTKPPLDATATISGIRCGSPVGLVIPTALASTGLAAAADALGIGFLIVGPVAGREVPDALRWLGDASVPVFVAVPAEDPVSVASQMRDRAAAFAVFPNAISLIDSIRAAGGKPVLIVGPASSETADVIVSNTVTIESALAWLRAGKAVAATPEAIVQAGPGWFQRVTSRLLAPESSVQARWSVQSLAGALFGGGMVLGGVGAAVVAMGPILLPYDAAYLRLSTAGLSSVNTQLVHFLQHDRVTLAGTMVALGVMYFALSVSGIRARQAWARDTMLASGAVGFPTLFYFFSYHYVEPLHVVLAAILFPLFVIAAWPRPSLAHSVGDGDEQPAVRARALTGQLLMVVIAIGLIGAGITISIVGLSTVFVPSDLSFMSTTASTLAAANDRLLGFIAHDRAGFGGALISAGVAILGIALWGWQRGNAWVWWCLFGAAVAGFGAAIAIHLWVGYTDFPHLLPVYAGAAVSAAALSLAAPHLLASPRTSRFGQPVETT